jgi:hypothetical protein
MAKYEALIEVSVEFEAEDSDSADSVLFDDYVNRLIDTAAKDDKFRLWVEVTNIEKIGD